MIFSKVFFLIFFFNKSDLPGNNGRLAGNFFGCRGLVGQADGPDLFRERDGRFELEQSNVVGVGRARVARVIDDRLHSHDLSSARAVVRAHTNRKVRRWSI